MALFGPDDTQIYQLTKQWTYNSLNDPIDPKADQLTTLQVVLNKHLTCLNSNVELKSQNTEN